MRIYIFLGLIFNIITIPVYGMETKKIKPLGIKNFPVPELDLDGVCGHIAKFQALNAGLHELSTDYVANGNNNLLWIMTQRYKQQQEKQNNITFDFNLNEIKEIDDNEGVYKIFNKYYSQYAWNNEENKNCVIQHESPEYNKPEELDLFLKNIFNKYSSYSQKPLVIIDLKHECGKKKFGYIETIEELQNIQAPAFQSNYTGYKLVGVVQWHNYTLCKKKFYLTEEILRRIFLRLPSRRFFINNYNPEWSSHLDAYVNYNNRWYLMDDEIRWKASTEKQQDSDLVAKALIDCYPGMPRILVYAPTGSSTNNAKTLESKKYSLTLKRDTKKPSVWKSLLVLLGGALCDGIAVGAYAGLISQGISHVLEDEPSMKNIKFASIVGLITSCASFIYHGRRIIPMHRSQVIYNSESPHKELGPREK